MGDNECERDADGCQKMAKRERDHNVVTGYITIECKRRKLLHG